MKTCTQIDLFPDACDDEMEAAFEEFVELNEMTFCCKHERDSRFWEWFSALSQEEYGRMKRFFDKVIEKPFVVFEHGGGWSGRGSNVNVYDRYDRKGDDLADLIPSDVDINSWGIKDGWFYFNYSHHDGGSDVFIRNLRDGFSDEATVLGAFENTWSKKGWEAGMKVMGKMCTKSLKKVDRDTMINCY